MLFVDEGILSRVLRFEEIAGLGLEKIVFPSAVRLAVAFNRKRHI